MSNPMCPVKVREAFNQILEYQNSTAGGREGFDIIHKCFIGLEKISKAFNLCPPINSSQDVCTCVSVSVCLSVCLSVCVCVCM